MQNLIKMTLAAVLACGSASAVTTFNFSGLSSNNNISSLSSYTTSGGIGVTVSAFYASGPSAAFVGATAANYNSYGLGVCNSNEACSSPDHQIDNSSGYEFMLFKFSTPVNLSTITLANYSSTGSTDRDMTYYTSKSTLASLVLGSINTMNAAFSAPTTVACASNCSGAAYGSTSVDSLAANGSGVTYLLVGAGLSSSNDDFFKIKSLDVNTASAATAAPEPSTIQSGLLALVVGLGFAGWRRRTSRNA